MQAAEKVRDPVSTLHHDVTRHVLEGSVGPPVICPLEVEKAAKGFVGHNLPTCCNEATGSLVQGLLEFGKDPLTWSVGGKSRHKVSVVNKN